ncbi:hypothetical protein M430DRAFT_24018 [Amorphotheca resinae ATCC 22711]|uniref:Uncharacterized protein n=1 Tax=Amorphotheca resinae ATCC 22711 TaxID=857342 RepID=A0A2T3BE22_AMORE|nr:hypothetical protein M430DRAFT_24018 [Amorphotheca resinae ATCC 22711]PSS27583.1 hypothetical protein M430DRAFT_24018 [Amorphotheca resinae ATCC 22711]
MAPTYTARIGERAYRYRYHSGGSSLSGGGIGGVVIGAIVVVMLAIFIGVFWYEYNKAQTLNIQRGTPNAPIRKGPIFSTAFWTALTFGLVGLFCASCLASSDNVTGNNDGGGSQDPSQMPEGGDTPGISPPQMGYQQNVDWPTLQSAATDPIQTAPIDDS